MKSREWKEQVIKQFNGWSEGKNRFFFEKRLGAIIPFIPEKARVLDVGCGDSEMLEKIKKGKKCRFLVGIDIHKKLVKKKGIYLLRGDAEFLPFRDSSFGCLISTATIEHLPSQKKQYQNSNVS